MGQPVAKSGPVSFSDTDAGPNTRICLRLIPMSGAEGCLSGLVAGSQGLLQQAEKMGGTQTALRTDTTA
jgi:hypothetical protein